MDALEDVLTTKLSLIAESLRFVIPELILAVGIILFLILGLVLKVKKPLSFFSTLALLLLTANLIILMLTWGNDSHVKLFGGMIQFDAFSSFLKIIFDLAGVFTALLSLGNEDIVKVERKSSEIMALLFSALLGAHFLVMSLNFVMVFLSIELLSISSYVLAGINGTIVGSEGSLKYYLYGAVASAVMLYGFTIFYGLSGTLDFSSNIFFEHLLEARTPLILVAGIFSLSGYLFKVTAAPMHIWAPDVYEAAPVPVIAMLSVVPKVAGIGALAKFILSINLFGQSLYDWQLILGIISITTICVGNFSALWQDHPKRLMAYSSIAQAGFMLIGIVSFSIQGVQSFLFYAFIYLLMNYLVFLYIQRYGRNGINTMRGFSGTGKKNPLPMTLLLIGLIALAGIPPTSGFMAKLFIFSAIWEAYAQSGKEVLMWLMLFGLLNTAVSLFFYLKIPYYAFLKEPADAPTFGDRKPTAAENFLAVLLVVSIVTFFFMPGLLMGWLNSINLVL